MFGPRDDKWRVALYSEIDVDIELDLDRFACLVATTASFHPASITDIATAAHRDKLFVVSVSRSISLTQ